ncbi:glycosyltransferase [Microbacterium tenebrionis]|uniref:glycosyltransferase n=1 Tax=Microbacterium tenebrionis TaxID=2830665 RepID=UPI0027DF93E0|nr:glycosyltransferase [Microbacterium tenebrionis]
MDLFVSPRCFSRDPSLRYARNARLNEEESIATTSARIRVASVPAAHPYVRAITDPRRVTLLTDPPVPDAPPEQWWPPVAMTGQWLSENAAEYDLLHVHFGLESFTPDELRAGLDAARLAGRPVVFTVHDLDNPQIVDQEPYRELLNVIVPAADHLITLTPSAAAEIERRWRRASTVLAHPTLLEQTAADSRVSRAGTVRVGIALRDLRPNIDAEGAVRAAARAAGLLEAAGQAVEIEVLMNDRVRDDRAAERVIDAADGHAAVRMRRTPYLSDAEIEEWLRGLDLFVLPYRHGTHSGWVELCYDLGVPVAGTDVGHIRSQHPSEFCVIDLDDPRTLAAAVTWVHRSPASSSPRATHLANRRAERQQQRRAIRAAHARLYSDAVAGVRTHAAAGIQA